MTDFRSRAKPATVGPIAARIRAEQGDLAQRPRALLAEFAAASLGGGYLRERYEALQCALTQPRVFLYEERAEIGSLANRRGITVQAMHAKKRSLKAQRELGSRIARAFGPKVYGEALTPKPGRFAVVVLTRIAPRPLDSDNLESAFKAVRDGIAEGLGIDDRSPLVRYVTSQEQGAPRQHSVRAELFIQPQSAQEES